MGNVEKREREGHARVDSTVAPDYRKLFEASPGKYLVLTRLFEIAAVSDAYLRATMATREQILGRHVFDVFPDNPRDPGADGARNLRSSLNAVLHTRLPHTMAVQKYDIPRPDGSGYEERYWSPINSPVLGDDGEVEYIIHRVEDVTELFRLNEEENQTPDPSEGPHDRSERLEIEALLRAQQLRESNQELIRVNTRYAEAVRALQAEVERRRRSEEELRTIHAELERRVEERTAELKRSEEMLRETFDLALSGIAHVGLDGRWLTVNRAVSRITGYAEDALKRRTVAELTHPDDIAIEREQAQRLLDGAIEGYSLEKRYIRPDESVVWVETTVSLKRHEDGTPQRFVVCLQDIDSRKRFQGELERTLESIADGFFAVDGNWRMIYVNQIAENLLGIDRKEVVGKSHWDVFPLALGTKLEEEYRRAASGEVRDFENFYESWQRWFHYRCYPRTGGGMSVYFTDITDRKRSEQAIKEVQERFQTVTDNAASCLFMMDKSGRPTFMNPAAKSVTGYSSLDEIKDRPLHYAVHWKRPDGSHYPMEECPIDNAQAELKPVQNQAEIFCRKDGSLFPVSYSIAPLERDGEVVGAVLEFRDVTQQREAERALRAREEELRTSSQYLANLIDSIPHMVWVTDQSGNLTRTNRRYVEFTGLPFDELKGVLWARVIHPSDAETARRAWSEAVRTNAPYLCHARLRRHDGEYRWQIARGLPYREADGSITWFGTNTDVHDEKMKSEELERSNAELARFAYVASHDLKEPLRTVSSYSQLLVRQYRGKHDDTTNLYVKYISQGVKRMYELIDGLLSFSRLGSSKPSLARVRARDALMTALSNLEKAIAETDAAIVIRELPEVVGDGIQLAQLFQNLISNALKYRSEKRPRIEVGATDEGNEWQFYVKDNGIGIAPEYHERIFVLFQRLHNKDAYSGTGIGLAVCKKIVERHGGRVWVESRAGEGSTFRFTLPKPA